MNERAGQLVVAAAVLALGVALAVGTWLLPDAPGYARVSARLFPALISGGLVITSALLLLEALAGGWRPVEDEAREPLDWRALGWISAGVIGHMALIAGIGFILASSLLYASVARGFHSTKPLRDCAIGILLGAILYLVFTRALTLNLPWGAWMPG